MKKYTDVAAFINDSANNGWIACQLDYSGHTIVFVDQHGYTRGMFNESQEIGLIAQSDDDILKLRKARLLKKGEIQIVLWESVNPEFADGTKADAGDVRAFAATRTDVRYSEDDGQPQLTFKGTFEQLDDLHIFPVKLTA